MIIRYDRDADPKLPRVFEAYDDYENAIGRAEVEVAVCPLIWASRPVMITVRLEGEQSADALLGAALTHAMMEAGRRGENACVRVELDAGDRRFDKVLEPLGFTGESSLLKMKKALGRNIAAPELPDGLTVLHDYLYDEEERRFYLERVNSIFGTDHDKKWLDELTAKPFFTRLLLIDKNGAAAEMAVWADGTCGVADNLWVHKEWRRKHVATYMMALAEQYWMGKGLTDARVEVWSRLTPAVTLAEKTGFVKAGASREYRYMDL